MPPDAESSEREAPVQPKLRVTPLQTTNPYQPPGALGNAVSLQLPVEGPSSRRAVATFILAATVLGSLTFVYFAESINQFTPPIGIVLIVSTAVSSIASAIITRDALLAPLCCLGGMMSGVTLAAMMKGWPYVSLEITIPLSIGASLPALVVAWLLKRRHAKRMRMLDNAVA